MIGRPDDQAATVPSGARREPPRDPSLGAIGIGAGIGGGIGLVAAPLLGAEPPLGLTYGAGAGVLIGLLADAVAADRARSART